jgi:pimeloyl-ACP methyl ester carboxylesterase
MSAGPAPVVLVHGAWHGAWGWATLQAELDRRGIPSFAFDLPGHGASLLPFGDLYGDGAHAADVVSAVAARAGRNVVLVGHSYGGAVITEAASRPSCAAVVSHLVYLAAHALDQGESVTDTGKLVDTPGGKLRASAVAQPDGTTVLADTDDVRRYLYEGTDPALLSALMARLCPQPAITFQQAVTGDPRASIRSTYVSCTLDEAIDVARQRVMAARCTDTYEFETGHTSSLSMTSETADVIEAIARSA